MNAAIREYDIRSIVNGRYARREQFIRDVKIVLLTTALFFAFMAGQSLYH